MGKILSFIEQKGEGNYRCYGTNKASLDTTVFDILNYDDKTVVTNKTSRIAETDPKLIHTVKIDPSFINDCKPIFTYFLDGSRHVYKVDDIGIGKKIFPVLAGQIIVGCCERQGRDSFKPLPPYHTLVIAMPDDFDTDDGGEDFCRLYCEDINEEIQKIPFVRESGIKIGKILLYRTDKKEKNPNAKDDYKGRGTAKIQNEMTNEEQRFVADLCRKNKLDEEHFLIKDGSLEYSPAFYKAKGDITMFRENYRFVVGVSKSFDPELLPDFEGHKLSKTIANLKPFERTKAYRYTSEINQIQYAVWYLRLRKNDFRETNFSDIIKCEMVIFEEEGQISTDLINIISANLIKEAYPVCYGNDSRWANHLYPVYLTESFCKSKYFNNDIILSLF